MLSIENTALIIIDVQGKLAHSMPQKKLLFENMKKLISGCKVLGVPILWVEQNPKGLGPTVQEISDLLTDISTIKKTSFSCCRNNHFMELLNAEGRKQLMIIGIETHVCVYQSTVNLLELDYEVNVIADAVSSRKIEDKEIGLNRMKDLGANLISTEIALFELLEHSENPKFREVLQIIK